MSTPTPGEIRFAELLLKTERKPRFDVDAVWEKIFSSAVVVTFVFFLFM
jgi:hypothetical protein